MLQAAAGEVIPIEARLELVATGVGRATSSSPLLVTAHALELVTHSRDKEPNGAFFGSAGTLPWMSGIRAVDRTCQVPSYVSDLALYGRDTGSDSNQYLLAM